MNLLAYLFIVVLVGVLSVASVIRLDKKAEEKDRLARQKRRNRIEPIFEVAQPQTENATNDDKTPKPHSYATFVPSLSDNNASKKPD